MIFSLGRANHCAQFLSQASRVKRYPYATRFILDYATGVYYLEKHEDDSGLFIPVCERFMQPPWRVDRDCWRYALHDPGRPLLIDYSQRLEPPFPRPERLLLLPLLNTAQRTHVERVVVQTYILEKRKRTWAYSFKLYVRRRLKTKT